MVLHCFSLNILRILLALIRWQYYIRTGTNISRLLYRRMIQSEVNFAIIVIISRKKANIDNTLCCAKWLRTVNLISLRKS